MMIGASKGSRKKCIVVLLLVIVVVSLSQVGED
jgi:flagellar basal body-associated protein FliL